MGQSTELDQCLNDLLGQVRSGTDTGALGNSVRRLAEIVRHVERDLASTQVEALAAANTPAPDVKALLAQLVDRIAAIPSLVDTAAAWQRRLAGSRSSADRGALLGELADRALYQAKEHGRNRCAVL